MLPIKCLSFNNLSVAIDLQIYIVGGDFCVPLDEKEGRRQIV